MTRVIRTSFAALALAAVPAVADDPKPKATPPADTGTSVLAPPSAYHPAGTVTGKVGNVSAGKGGGTVTLSVPEVEPSNSRSRSARPTLRVGHKDVVYDLADDLKVRFAHPPKTLPPRDNLPGYRAERSDLHAGQTVKLTLGKKAEPGARLSDVKPVVTMVTIEVDAPAPKDEKKADKAKK